MTRGHLLIRAWAYRHGLTAGQVVALTGADLRELQPVIAEWLDGLSSDPLWIDDTMGAIGGWMGLVNSPEWRGRVNGLPLGDGSVAYLGRGDDDLAEWRRQEGGHA